MITSNRHTQWPDFPLKEKPATTDPAVGTALGQALQKSGQVLQQTFAGIPASYLAAAFAAGLVLGWIAKKR